MTTTTPENKTYHGNCHCGAIKFSLEHPSLEDGAEVTSCNCSICARNGYLLIYPKIADFTLHSGKEALKSYQFGKKNITHKFCGDCGTSVFAAADSYGVVAVNVRTFKDIDIDALKLKKINGKNLDPPYDA